MGRAIITYCTYGAGCKNITERGNSTPTVLRNGRTVCSYCLKRDTGFARLTTDPQMVSKIGREKRGRPSLDLDDQKKRERLLAQRAIAQLKQRHKNKLLDELGSESHPDWEQRWEQIELAIETKKSEKWGKQVEVKSPKTFHAPAKYLEKGVTDNGRYEWYLLSEINSYTLRIHKIDKLTKSRSDPFTVKNLTEITYKSAVKKLEDHGINSLQAIQPISSYTSKAKEFKDKFFSSQLTKNDLNQLQKQMTFGFLFALYLLEKPTTDKSRVKAIYAVIGDVKIPFEAGPLQISIKNWTQALCDTTISSSTYKRKRLSGPKTKSTLKKLLAIFMNIIGTLEDYQSVFPWAANSTRTIEKYRNLFEKESLKNGKTSHGQGFRCLRLSEITAIFNEAPTISHAALLALALSSGLRPEELAKITPEHWDKESGKIYFSNGKLLSGKLAGHDPKYLANPRTSTVVRLILLNKEFLDLSNKEKLLDWFSKPAVTSISVMKASPTLQRIASYTHTPVATLRDFRTTCATMLSFCGVELNAIQERLGHKTSLTTAEFYVKAMPPDAGSFADIRDPLMRGIEYLRQPEIVFPDGDIYKDDNVWDTFILAQFCQRVYNLKIWEYQSHEVVDAEEQVLIPINLRLVFTQAIPVEPLPIVLSRMISPSITKRDLIC